MNDDDKKRAAQALQAIQDEKFKQEIESWISVMKTYDGRLIVNSLMWKFGLYANCFDKNGSEMAQKASRQGCAQEIMGWVNHACGGDTWRLMEQEEQERKRLRDKKIDTNKPER